MNPLRIALNWIIFLALIAGLYFAWPYIPRIHTPVISVPLTLLFALSCAFTVVEVLKIGSVKPFNCIKCLTGWFALIIALCFHNQWWYFMLPCGLFVGGLFEAVKMKL